MKHLRAWHIALYTTHTSSRRILDSCAYDTQKRDNSAYGLGAFCLELFDLTVISITTSSESRPGAWPDHRKDSLLMRGGYLILYSIYVPSPSLANEASGL